MVLDFGRISREWNGGNFLWLPRLRKEKGMDLIISKVILVWFVGKRPKYFSLSSSHWGQYVWKVPDDQNPILRLIFIFIYFCLCRTFSATFRFTLEQYWSGLFQRFSWPALSYFCESECTYEAHLREEVQFLVVKLVLHFTRLCTVHYFWPP